MPRKLLIWGGNGHPLSLENLNSHASVSAFFLGRELARDFEIISLTDMDKPEELLDHTNVDAMLSCFQYGFTSRIIDKGKCKLFDDLRSRFRGPICSIMDCVDLRRYCENVLFTVLPAPGLAFRTALTALHLGHGPKTVRMGWSAAPDQCRPDGNDNASLRIFVDHSCYTAGDMDLTGAFFKACQMARKSIPDIPLHVRQQSNDGIIDWDLSGSFQPEIHQRSHKVPWLKMMDEYSHSNIFFVTHRESAGLAVIEAAMSGATIYVPDDGISFISPSLLGEGVPHRIIRCKTEKEAVANLAEAILADAKLAFRREENHRKLAASNSWECAAGRIRKTLASLGVD
ncbi:MAG: hypothetical protein A2X49_03605 [Lentisphaerae bacterium GWF2_52_8]|nr:MAG: hypothetical protein A2X49_03605 [Lentisphaerae bacterium GWF2_52_8]